MTQDRQGSPADRVGAGDQLALFGGDTRVVGAEDATEARGWSASGSRADYAAAPVPSPPRAADAALGGAGRGGLGRFVPATRTHGSEVVTYTLTPEELEKRFPAGREAVTPLPRRQRDRQLVEAWADTLAPCFTNGCSLNFTGTYTDTYGYEHGCTLPRNVLKDFQRFLKAEGLGSKARCVGVERHRSGRSVLHFHALVGGVHSDLDVARLSASWEASRGWCRVKRVNRREGAVEYAAKHLLKQGSADCFDFFVPAPSRHATRSRIQASTTTCP